MELYGRFIVTLAFGLLGLGLVLQVLLDQVFSDWDVVADTRAGLRRLARGGLRHRHAEDVLLDIDKDRPKEFTTRLSNTARRETVVLPAIPAAIRKGSATARNPVYDEDWG